MTNDLIERYLYAVTKRMNPKIREDVKTELRGLVEDMLAERCGGRTATEKDVRIVLLELGSPQELYARYDSDSKDCLIGQPYYSTYLLVLRIVLTSVAAGLTVANLLLQMMDPQPWGEAVITWLGYLWSSVLGAFAFLTLLFAFFYHKGVKLDEPFNFDNLPPVPQKKQEISMWEPIFSIGFSVIFLILFLAAPQVLSVLVDGREWVPLFDAGALRDTWYIIVLFAAAGIVRETVKLLEKRYSKTVMLTSIGCNLISAVLGIWWLVGHQLFNPEFTGRMTAVFVGEAAWIGTFFENFQLFFLGIILFALMLDTVTAAAKSMAK